MIENLALHGVRADDLVPSLMTTHTVANPEYDPAEAQKQADKRREDDERTLFEEQDDISEATVSLSPTADSPKQSSPIPPSHDSSGPFQTTARVLENTATSQLAGVTTSLSSVDENVTLDIRWTVLCDLFLVLIADSVYDARSRVLLENVGIHLGLGWLDLVKFEQRITEALEIQEGAEKTEQRDVLEGREKSSRRRRYMMVGLATLGAFSVSRRRCTGLKPIHSFPSQVEVSSSVYLLDCLLPLSVLVLVLRSRLSEFLARRHFWEVLQALL